MVALDPKGVSASSCLLDAGRREQRFVAFDLLWLDGEDLRARPLEERRELLQSVLANAARGWSGCRSGRLARRGGRCEQRHGWEGLIAKRKGSRYVAGASSDWLKLKVHGTGAGDRRLHPIKGHGDKVGALLVGYARRRAALRRQGRHRLGASSAGSCSRCGPTRWRGEQWARPGCVTRRG